jgi:alpha-1,6-mannosyltransferase
MKNDIRLQSTSDARLLPLRVLGTIGLIAIVASVLLICAGAAHGPSQFVPARSGGWFGWLAGPLSGLGVGTLSATGFQTLTLIMCGGYAAVLVAAGARALSLRAIAAAIVVANAILLLGPPLISQDVFGYLSFARMGVLHGLDPYTHVAAQAPIDSVYAFIGWPYQHSPYGPLFTLASYAVAPLGLAGGLWALKAVAILGSLSAVALTARAAGLLGGSRRFAAAFVGCNPVMLELAVGGAHNDTLVIAFLAGALALTAGEHPRNRPGALALAAGVGLKITAGVTLPFLVLGAGGDPSEGRSPWHERARVALAALAGLALVAAIGLIGFGSHALGFLNAVGEQQQMVATHSVPAETARLFRLNGTPGWWRESFTVAFVLVLVYALWRTARGADWREAAGWSTLALLVATAWLLPWYAIWPLPLAAVCRDWRLRTATLLVCAYAVAIHLTLANPLLSPPAVHGPPRHGHIGALGR